MIMKMKPNSYSQDQNMQFPMIYISHYTMRYNVITQNTQ